MIDLFSGPALGVLHVYLVVRPWEWIGGIVRTLLPEKWWTEVFESIE
jgi:hypothetical protein